MVQNEYAVCRHPQKEILIAGDHVALVLKRRYSPNLVMAEDFEVCKNYPEIETLVPVDDMVILPRNISCRHVLKSRTRPS